MPDTTKDAAAATGGVGTDLGDPPARVRAIETGGRSLRAHAARGVIVNGVFDVGLSALSLIRGFVLAALLTRSDYGLWGVLVVSLGVLARLKVVGISDKYLQQDDADQELAFQKAFTLEVLMTAAAMVPIAAALPVVAVVYGHWKLVAPGIVLLTVLIADALQAPFWIYSRKMNFVAQRSLGAIEPIVGFVLAIGLAFAGLGYWALAIGVVAGAWAGAIAAVVTCPFALRWRYDRRALRVYARFSGPIFVATASTVVLANATTIATNARLGLAGVGAVALASNVTAFTSRVDDLVSGTLYPAICAIQSRLDLLRESFQKSNRLALMWAVPLGAGLALFAGDLVRFALGEKWRPAIVLLQITGVVAAVSQVGFNWDDYFRARGNTMPLAVAGVASTAALLGVGLPLLFADGLTGLGIGIAAGAGVHVAFRAYFLSRLFEGFAFIRHATRAMVPTFPAVGAVLLVRAFESGARSGTMAVVELAVYVIVTLALTWLIEGALVREALGYLRARAR
ncbi:MAG: oligosaccharide flippase family protein [Solirubrobacteraceae bacterium]